MPLVKVETLDALRNLSGEELAVTPWFEVRQEHIDRFADATEDHQWIHVDRERAKRESPYGATIAHGFLTLSLLSRFMREALEVGGLRMAVNYGLNRVRFPSPVRSGSRVRARIVLKSVRELSEAVEATYSATIESERSEKPCCVAEWLVRYYR
jgi:acyl dehydratase